MVMGFEKDPPHIRFPDACDRAIFEAVIVEEFSILSDAVFVGCLFEVFELNMSSPGGVVPPQIRYR